MNIVIVGHVDHGKSTLIGRLLTDTGSIAPDRMAKVEAVCKRLGKEFEHAFLLDALEEEQEQGITIDTTQLLFSSDERDYVIIDAPGHREFLKNMVSGAATAEAALIIVDADEGIQEQSKRHGYILSLLNIKQVILVLNKMDLVKYKQDVFDHIVEEYSQFLKLLKIKLVLSIPVSARKGDNVAWKSKQMKWYTGKTVLQAIDALQKEKGLDKKSLRLPIQDVYKFEDKRIIAGRIESGALRVGDRVAFCPGDKFSVVKEIVTWKSPKTKEAGVGHSIGLTLTDELFIERGQVMSRDEDRPMEGNIFSANIFWMGKNPLKKGKTYELRLATCAVDAEISVIDRIMDSSTLKAKKQKKEVKRNEVAEVVIKTKKPIAFDNFSEVYPLGRFVIVEDYDICGGGIIIQRSVLQHRTLDKKAGSESVISPTVSLISSEEREKKNKHKGKVIWITGIPGSGRNTIAKGIERKLFDEGYQTYLMSGANFRYGLSSDLDYSDEARHEQTRRLAEVGKMFVDAGVIVVISSVSPFIHDREQAKQLIGRESFVEVQVECPKSIARKRNPHGLMEGSANISGFDAPYEVSQQADIYINTKNLSREKSVNQVYKKLESILLL